jgi:hypothetical protein
MYKIPSFDFEHFALLRHILCGRKAHRVGFVSYAMLLDDQSFGDA